jgi:hypothetical protein
MRRIYFLFSVVFLLATHSSNAQWQGNDSGMCPNGQWVPSGPYGGMMCVPNQQSTGNDCGNGRSCPYGTQCCNSHNLCCSAGNYCSVIGCVPVGAVSCGNGYCDPGMACWTTNGRPSCITQQAAFARTHAQSLATWLAKNAARAMGNLSDRTDRAMIYALNDPNFTSGLADLLVNKLLIPDHLIPAKKAALISGLAGLSMNTVSCAQEHHFQCALDVTDTICSTFLAYLGPETSQVAAVLHIAGGFSTAYLYGYFFARN